jgi:outer membrane lipoprotein-sorting protein
MKPADNIEEVIKKNLNFTAGTELHDRMLDDVLNAQVKSKKTKSALVEPNIRRIIMKSPITKLTVAAVVITVVALGLFEFIGTGSTSGVVWAEVAKKVQASRGVIFRSRDTAPDSRDGGPDYTMNYLYSAQLRLDSYKGAQIIKTFYSDYNTKTSVFIDHGHKSYIKRTVEKMEQNDLWTDPKSMVQRFLSHEHRELGQKTVEGVLCEGIETTDPAFDGTDYPVDSLMARIWVSVETGYPVQFEVEIVRNNGQIRIAGVADQFQWDVELDESIFEPNIPADYIDIWPGE